MAVKKRFIAGAVCPGCGAQDRVVMFADAGRRYRECVDCGFRDEIRIDAPARELDTRVNRSDKEERDEARPVRILDPRR